MLIYSSQQEKSPTKSGLPYCRHCGAENPPGSTSGFCCPGCESVYGLLQERGLGRFYELQSQGRFVREATPVSLPSQDFTYLDDPESLGVFAVPTPLGLSMKFYLDGAHCTACVWLTEKLPDFVPGIQEVRLNLAQSVLSVTVGPQGSFAAVARELGRMGYSPRPLEKEGTGPGRNNANRKLLTRAGVAAACAGNIMLLSASIYAGASGPYAELFRWLSFVLALPVLGYSAQPFFLNAWIAVRNRQVSIDIPIALGILLGGLSSVFNLVTGSPYLYFDSLSSLVFLMLASRYILARVQQRAIDSIRLAHFLTPSRARVRVNGAFIDRPTEQVRAGDWVEVHTGECIPVDGVVVEGCAFVNSAVLTGESLPAAVRAGQAVFAGSANEGGRLLVRATAIGSSSRVGKILSDVEESLARRAPVALFADRVARAFVVAVVVSVAVVFVVGLRSGLHSAVDLALALAIVTCPCAFALATPLALSISIGRLARRGILIRGADTLERLSRVDRVLFDKTGTLTTGHLSVLSIMPERDAPTSSEIASMILTLERRSNHPVARALVHHFKDAKASLPELRVDDFHERLGTGVSGRIGGHRVEIRAIHGEPDALSCEVTTEIGLYRDGKLLARILLGDQIRPEARFLFARLRAKKLPASILSGDASPAVDAVATELGLSLSDAHSGLSPEEKRAFVENHPNALMVGDGANDAAALAGAYTSIAVQGGMELSLRSSDGYFQARSIAALDAVLTVAEQTMRVIHRNFALSIAYNVLGIAGVIYGRITPLAAAVLMPVSALAVFGSSLIGTSTLRSALREMKK